MSISTILRSSIFTLRNIIDNLSLEKTSLIEKDTKRRYNIQKERSTLRALFKQHQASLSKHIQRFDRQSMNAFFKESTHPEQVEHSSLFYEMLELEKKALALKKENKELFHFTKYYQTSNQPVHLQKKQNKIQEIS